MKNPKSSSIVNPFQWFSEAFVMLFARIENVLYLSIPVNLLKVILFAGVTSILPKLIGNALYGIFLMIAVFIAIYFINSYITLIYAVFLLNKNSSLSQSVAKIKTSYRMVLSSDLFFLLISSFIYIPLITINNMIQQVDFLHEISISTVLIVSYGVFALLWFCFFFVPYHSSIRLFLIHDSTLRLVVWKRGYQMYWKNFLTIFIYYACFGILYILLTNSLSNYLYFEILMMVLIPFQASLDAASYEKLKTTYGTIFGSRNPDRGS